MILPFRDPNPDRPRPRRTRCTVRVLGRVFSLQREAFRRRWELLTKTPSEPPRPA